MGDPAGAGMVISLTWSRPKRVSSVSSLVRFEKRNATLTETAERVCWLVDWWCDCDRVGEGQVLLQERVSFKGLR